MPEEEKEAAVSTKDLESSGDEVKRNVIPTEVFEEGMAHDTDYDYYSENGKNKENCKEMCVFRLKRY